MASLDVGTFGLHMNAIPMLVLMTIDKSPIHIVLANHLGPRLKNILPTRLCLNLMVVVHGPIDGGSVPMLLSIMDIYLLLYYCIPSLFHFNNPNN